MKHAITTNHTTDLSAFRRSLNITSSAVITRITFARFHCSVYVRNGAVKMTNTKIDGFNDSIQPTDGRS